jgi:hypothetical protein
VLPDVVDASEDKSLARLARALTDSLGRSLRAASSVHLLHGQGAQSTALHFLDPRPAGQERRPEVLVAGRIGPAGDSLEVTIDLRDPQNPGISKSLRHVVSKADSAGLVGAVVPMVKSWVEHREQSSRAARTLTAPNRLQLDSLLRINQFLREAMRRRPRPDSPPAPPIP